VTSWWAILAVPAATLIGFAFAGIAMTATTFMSSWQDFDLVQLVLMPLFLFSATFYPLEVYPTALQAIVVLSPLYHGVELVRGLMLGVLGRAAGPRRGARRPRADRGAFAAQRLDTLLVR
jgi:lipooligosaccharide transport system permease protein